ncbi:MAG: hypothetical protein ABIO43_13400 [Sphingomicrobium sp.]
MTREEMLADQKRLQELLHSYESGGLTHFDEDEKGELTRDVTEERIASVRERLAWLDKRLAEKA